MLVRKIYPYLLFLLAPIVTACSGSALQIHARSATVVGSTLSVVRVGVRESRQTALREMELQTVGRPAEERLDAMDRVIERFAPAVIAFNATQVALDAWINTLLILAADEAGDGIEDELLTAAASLLRSWSPMATSLRHVGVEVPDLPAPLVSLFSDGEQE